MSIPIRVWKGERNGQQVLIAARSERRAAEILGIPIIRLRDWESQPYAPWMEIGKVYQYNHRAGIWEEAE